MMNINIYDMINFVDWWCSDLMTKWIKKSWTYLKFIVRAFNISRLFALVEIGHVRRLERRVLLGEDVLGLAAYLGSGKERFFWMKLIHHTQEPVMILIAGNRVSVYLILVRRVGRSFWWEYEIGAIWPTKLVCTARELSSSDADNAIIVIGYGHISFYNIDY